MNRNGNLNVPYLYENDDKVKLNWNWLDNNFNSDNPAVRVPKLSSFLSQHLVGRVFLYKTAVPTAQVLADGVQFF